MLTRDQAKQLVEKVLSFSTAGDCAVTVGALDLAQTRFAANSITTSGKSSGIAINISVTKDRRTGAIATNETEDGALRAAVARAEELASFAPQDPEYVEPLAPRQYPETSSFDEATSRAGQPEMVPGVKAAIEGAEKQKLRAAGYFELETESLAVGNQRGNFAYARRTDAEFSLTARTPDGTGSGWASAESVRMSDLDAPRTSGIAIEKSLLSQKPRPIEPGKYTVVLEPAAVSGLMLFMFGGFDARAAEEGRSLLTRKGSGTRLGEKLFSEKITARTDPFDPRQAGLPWSGNVSTSLGGAGQLFFGGGDDDGSFLPAEKITWIEKGVVKNLGYSRYWAKQKDTKPTPDPGSRLVMDGEDHSVEDLIRSTDRGLLVTRFWYVRFVNPQTVQLTGLTRDGLFWIEKGKISHPVMNLRWNESVATVLANVEMLGRPERSGNRVVPAMKVRDFTFTSVSDAV